MVLPLDSGANKQIVGPPRPGNVATGIPRSTICLLYKRRDSMNPANRARVEAWLRYTDNLGLSPYYRDRPIGQNVHAQAQQFAEPEIAGPAQPASPVLAAAPTRQIPAPAPKPASALPVLPFGTGASLFDERISGDTLD